jgi:Mn-containing catalase
VILRYDRLGVEIPPGDPDPAGAMAVQELMGARFGEMSTLMNYTFQSFGFRGRRELRPFYDLIANIAAEEYGHIEAVGATITSMLSGADARQIVEQGSPAHFLKSGKGVLPIDSGGAPWTGDYVFSSGDVVEVLTHNFFLETGARNGKLKVYEAVDHPAARALTGYLLIRGGVHQVAYARALELVTGVDLTNAFPMPRIPTDKIPECRPYLEQGSHLTLYRFTPEATRRSSPSSRARTRRPARSCASSTRRRRGFRGRRLQSRRTSSRPTTRPARSPRSQEGCAGKQASRTTWSCKQPDAERAVIRGRRAPEPQRAAVR